MRDVVSGATTCRTWKAGLYHGFFWNELCSRHGWPRRGRLFFTSKLAVTRRYAEAEYTSGVLSSQARGGILMMHAPEPVRTFNWVKGVYEETNTHALVTGRTAPTFELEVWDTRSMRHVRSFGVGAYTCADIHDGLILFALTVSPNLVALHQATGKRVEIAGAHMSTITCVAVLNGVGVSGSYDQTVRLWDLHEGKEIRCFVGHETRVWSLALHGTLVASGANEGFIRVWDAQDDDDTGYVMQGHTRTVMSLQFDPVSPDDTLWSTGYDGSICCWNFRQETRLQEIRAHEDVVFSMVVTPYVVMTGSRDRRVRIWDRDSGQLLRSLEGHTGDVKALTLLPNGAIASASYDGTVMIWSFSEAQQVGVGDAVPGDKCVVM